MSTKLSSRALYHQANYHRLRASQLHDRAKLARELNQPSAAATFSAMASAATTKANRLYLESKK